MSERITIPVEVSPDISFVREDKEPGASNKSYHFFAFMIEHGMVMIQECDQNGVSKSYNYPKYYGCRIKNGRVEILNERHGWRVDEEATKKYADIKAEKELLDT
jgi:hypothetical protein